VLTGLLTIALVNSPSQAAPVVCDPDEAERILTDARIAPARVPIIQPNLLPGLARDRANPEVATAIEALCAEGDDLSLAPAERWETPRFGALSFTLTRTTLSDCALLQDAVVLTVGVDPTAPEEPLVYGLRSTLPRSVTPLEGEDCDQEARFRTETLLDGEGTPVRVVRITDEGANRDDDGPSHRIVVRRATPSGWIEDVLLDPAPDRLVDGGDGPTIALATGTDRDADPWIVAHDDRRLEDERCVPLPGQTVWRWDPGAQQWDALTGRDALGRLADRGLWRLAGDDGWFLILAQDIPIDRDLLEARMRRIARRHDDPISIRESAQFPNMNAGFLIVSPDPWPTREEAEKARPYWGRRTGVYVKRGWSAPDTCEP
jgi:hypothetical protein